MSEREALAALAWLVENGADEVLEQAPVNRLAAPPAPPVERPRPAAPAPPAERSMERRSTVRAPEPPPVWTPPAESLAAPVEGLPDAEALARGAESIEALHTAIRAFEGCALKASAKNTVIGRGNPDAKLILIGEAPGANEDRLGKPFVGEAGRLLDEMLKWVGLDESNVYITNVLFWRPPGNRNPTDAELALCRPFIDRQIELMQPNLLMFLGGIAAKSMLHESRGILKLRGHWYDYQTTPGGGVIPALATLHPAYLLRQPAQKRFAWRDFLKFKQAVSSGVHNS